MGGNPISLIDPDGLAIINPVTVSMAYGAVSGAIQTANSSGGWTSANALKIAGGALAGAASGAVGAVIPARLGLGAAALGGAAAGAGGNIASQKLGGEACINKQQVAAQAIIGFVGGGAGFGAAALAGRSGSAAMTGALAGGATQVWANLPVPGSFGGYILGP